MSTEPTAPSSLFASDAQVAEAAVARERLEEAAATAKAHLNALEAERSKHTVRLRGWELRLKV